MALASPPSTQQMAQTTTSQQPTGATRHPDHFLDDGSVIFLVSSLHYLDLEGLPTYDSTGRKRIIQPARLRPLEAFHVFSTDVPPSEHKSRLVASV